MCSACSRKDLGTNELQALCDFLLQNTVDGKIRHGTVNKSANKFKVCRKIVQHIRKKVTSSLDMLSVVKYLKKNNNVYVGRERIDRKMIQERVKAVQFRKNIEIHLHR